ncbi:multiple monosaccharide ABC transporter substrate-binding protein [Halalkalibacter akibai]|uniref:L-arabinose-binding periplasmic protein AraF n=1 Tax=Halalkalibacter akibai (strain ATCC 43226 / DSM 21942 / CIP 109018 / JCM 9157 / 1139) TaxID=1236973 RepID=W4QZN5_HALA3|nr:multiple monosaccharide ABC transporter substrate-binding protein [Halalkalibacter akibai]GAE36774.1 L-arabinose-binding periplasmic protein precursor AraF [Halalkalibacter akibai JCM 9157]
MTACGGSEPTGGGNGESGFVGVSMPSKSLERWVHDGDNMVKELEAMDYKVVLQYAEDVVETQVSQIENMITQGVDVLVIAAIDGEALTNVLQMAADSDIPVIAYDRLIRGSEHVTYYATFDNFKVGVQQGTYLVEALDLENQAGPFNIELFGGSPDDNNAYFFYNGAMSILQPYIDSGKLVVKSGQTGMDKVATLNWNAANSQSRMDNLLSTFYTDEEVDAVLSPNDGLAIGIISALKNIGYTELPVITGQDAELQSLKAIIAGDQAMTVFKDTRLLAEKVVEMVSAVIEGEEAEVNDTETYDNGVKVIPSYLLEPIQVDINNYEEVILGSGYYTEDQLN